MSEYLEDCMMNRFLNCLSQDRLQKAAMMKKHLFVVLAAVALAVVGAMISGAAPVAGATPVQNPQRGARPVPNPGSGGPPAQDVNVANPATAPVLALNVNDVGRIPYQSMKTGGAHQLGNNQWLCVFPNVPSGHRLVVQHVSGQLLFNRLPTSVSVTLSNLAATQLRSIFPVPNPQAFDQPVLVYYDAEEVPLVIITTDSQSGAVLDNLVGLAMTGYLVDCGIGPCAAIAN
jgi:hypothetical protein